MNYRSIILLPLFFFSLIQCKELLKIEDNRALPLPAKTEAVKEPSPPKKTEDRGWNNWNAHHYPSESSNEWSNENWNKEPSVPKLPRPSWESHGSEKPCCGKDRWGLPNIPDQTNGWNDDLRPDGLPSSHSEPEPEHESQWLPPDNNVDSIQEEAEWTAPQWKPSPEKKPCDCEKRGLNAYDPSPAFNFPENPSGIRPNKKNGWGIWNGLPSNDFEKNMKGPNNPKKEVIDNKSVNNKESESGAQKSADTKGFRHSRERF